MATSEMDSKSNIQRHLEPLGFQPVIHDINNYNGPTQEKAKSSKSELWLIKVPHNFDPESLSGKKVVFDSICEVSNDSLKNDDSASKRYQVLSKTCKESELSSFRMLLPSSKTEEICPCKPFSGQLSIVQTANHPVVEDNSILPQAQHELKHSVRCRWKPFGFKEPVVKIAKKKKKRNTQGVSKKHESTLSSETVTSNIESPRKKRKHRHKEKKQ